MPVDQHLGDPRPGLIELRRPMRRLAEQDHASVGKALDQAAQLVQIPERQGGFRHEPAQALARTARALLRHQQPGSEAGWLRIDLRLLGLPGLCPALFPDQGHEGHGTEIFLFEAVRSRPANAHQHLRAAPADRDDQPSARRELALQRLGDLRTAGRDDDGFERGFLRQSLRPIGVNDLDIGVAEPLQPRPGESRKLLMTFDGIDLVRHPAHHRRGIARARADLEHRVAGLDLGQLDHAGDNIGLRDGLPRLDRQRRIFIGEFLQMLGDESFARHCAHGSKEQRIGDAAGAKVARDHDSPVADISVIQNVGALYGHEFKTISCPFAQR